VLYRPRMEEKHKDSMRRVLLPWPLTFWFCKSLFSTKA
jgi:hypothetical protein